MTKRSLADWLRWQESLNPAVVDLGLDRVRVVAERLALDPPRDSVFTVAGTNGKGTTVALLDNLLAANDWTAGVYTSPHLVRYNERVRVAGKLASDDSLIASWEAVEASRDDVPLTYFEFGTLAALWLFSREDLDAWILEVGLGGRLDAVNVVDPDIAIITTIALDHEEWLGGSLAEIAAEKAGIMRFGRPVFYGDRPVPAVITAHAKAMGADLECLGEAFDYEIASPAWCWSGARLELKDLPWPAVRDDAQARNASVALAAVEARDSDLLAPAVVATGLSARSPDGRFQLIEREHQWVLDVAHNPQAAALLRDRLTVLPATSGTTAVVGLLADKRAEPFVAELAGTVDEWITCTVDDPRASDGSVLAEAIQAAGISAVVYGGTPAEAFDLAQRRTPAGGRILVCGSFRVVGPALQWLGLY